MSGAFRKRGPGRPNGDGTRSGIPARQGDRLQVPYGCFDGPASGGDDGSATGSQGRRSSNPPSVSEGRQSPTRSRQTSASGTQVQSPPGARQVSASGSQFQPPPGARQASGSGSQPQSLPAKAVDPARDPVQEKGILSAIKNIDFPISFYDIEDSYVLPTELVRRPGFNTSGKPVQLQLNAHVVTQYPQVTIYQYDVIIGNYTETNVVKQKVWNSKIRKERTGPQIIYDGNQLAWSLKDYDEIRAMVDLDVEQGRKSVGEKNTFRLHIRRTKVLDPSIIQQYLEGRIQMGIPVVEAINFMDHLLRQGPSTNPDFIAVKRSFFKVDGDHFDLSGSIDVVRGVYQSMRLAEGKKLIVNIDVANTCFWQPLSLMSVLSVKWRFKDGDDISHKLKPVHKNGSVITSDHHKEVERTIKKVRVIAVYDGNPQPNREWTIKSILPESAHEHKIQWKDPITKKETGEMISIHQYFRRKYNKALRWPHQPLVQMTKKNVLFPLELLHLVPRQRYAQKLDEVQTANMIKFAAGSPQIRLNAINEGRSMLNWSKDPYLTNYGLKIDPKAINTNARLLPPPGVRFGNKVEQPGTKGRWDLRGKTFLSPNSSELKSWGVGMFPGRIKPDKALITKFVNDFSRAYRSHGGKVATRPPNIIMLPTDPAQGVDVLHNTTGNMFNAVPQLMVFLVQDKQSFHYTRIKKSADCRFGVVSQVMQLQQVLKGNPQYYSNVCMKVNAKLGGCTSEAVPNPASGTAKVQKIPTMIIGADVSHASPGSIQPSMAAITVSWDRQCSRYIAACEVNGNRAEMIAESNWFSMLKPMVSQWQADIGGGRLPQQIYYIRDGVSEGQYSHVLKEEVPKIREILYQVGGDRPFPGKLTVIIASKRHHIRAFPQQNGPASDVKGNPLPGILIERDVTMAKEWDFYLYAHIALQGTSRPVHYTVLYDEAKHAPEHLQNMIYEHCYQYIRSTTSVSIHPAVYYAHLASNRAKSHEPLPSAEGPQSGSGFKMQNPGKEQPTISGLRLLQMPGKNKIQWTMWYV